MRFALLAPIHIDGETVQIDASIGATTATAGTLDALLRAADADMYHEKANRRHLSHVTAPPLKATADGPEAVRGGQLSPAP
ncbi:hypothetical protein AB0K00_48985 [Dactylosporangium sp. NPDC049525]|uniref:hypothetical protein n=1 Tax=Dactylosporangium sp. NPDC049525 TaxID=3154730 RepID=UPI003419DB6B